MSSGARQQLNPHRVLFCSACRPWCAGLRALRAIEELSAATINGARFRAERSVLEPGKSADLLIAGNYRDSNSAWAPTLYLAMKRKFIYKEDKTPSSSTIALHV